MKKLLTIMLAALVLTGCDEGTYADRKLAEWTERARVWCSETYRTQPAEIPACIERAVYEQEKRNRWAWGLSAKTAVATKPTTCTTTGYGNSATTTCH